ncbi:MAG: type II toxin-antitoxin system VapC family toxin [Xenococcaceae cyanobacterium MO_207.B15]|nr:type II toxin-antitoxin system VapC family toxin [Xenococcaceae cyanobacterium MO_207.B15]MDJ0746368.1 type II toxin-antitoxin system VapC family toxin [Xenococcaceae cyanobacterium MO_167.B27]
MARLNEINSKKIALDTVVFIYALEANDEFGELAKQIFVAIEQEECRGFASDLVLAELMVKPLREGKPEIAEEYASELPNFPNLKFLCPTRDIIITAAKLRGSNNLKLINALHLATAINAECQIFITNDAAMKCNISHIDIWLISEIEF